MTLKHDLHDILKSLSPTLSDERYVFVTLLNHSLTDVAKLNPLGIFQEKEGVTAILTQESADRANLLYNGSYQQITLNVHSSLQSVGLTAIVASNLAKAGISLNVWAGFYHDHLFVPQADAKTALTILESLEKSINAMTN